MPGNSSFGYVTVLLVGGACGEPNFKFRMLCMYLQYFYNYLNRTTQYSAQLVKLTLSPYVTTKVRPAPVSSRPTHLLSHERLGLPQRYITLPYPCDNRISTIRFFVITSHTKQEQRQLLTVLLL